MTNHEAARSILKSARERGGMWMGDDFIPYAVLEIAITKFLDQEVERQLQGTDGLMNPIGILGDLWK